MEGKVNAASSAQMEEWLKLAPFPLILYAAECSRGKKLPAQYITKLLNIWKKADITTVELARRQHDAVAKTGSAPVSGAKSTPTALQYAQRSYSEEELDSLTADLTQFMGEEKNDSK